LSVHHLSLVREIKDLKGPARAVLIVLADRADDNGKCYPGMGRIAAESGFSRSTVKTALKALKSDGLISWEQRHSDDGDLTSNLYTLDLGRLGADLPRSGAGLGVGQELPQGRSGAGHKASLKHQEESTLLRLGDDAKPSRTKTQERAAEIYAEYPKREGRKPALDEITKSMRAFGYEFLLERTRAYAKAITWKDRQFIPLPATWFRQERFNDDPESWQPPRGTNHKPSNFTSDQVGI